MRLRLLSLLLLCVGAAGCDSRFNADVVSEKMEGAVSIQAVVDGIELQKEDDSTDDQDRDTGGSVDFVKFPVSRGTSTSSSAFDIITDAKVDKDTYTGVRVKFSDGTDDSTFEGNNELFDGDDEKGNMKVIEHADAFVPVTFKLKDDDKIRIHLVLDERLSIQRNDKNDYSFDPSFRAVVEGDEATVSGDIDAKLLDDDDCFDGKVTSPSNDPNDDGIAVYAFEGNSGVTPKERDGDSGTQPFATTPVTRTSTTSGGTYRFDLMPAGNYTLALTCDGEFENGAGPARDPRSSDQTGVAVSFKITGESTSVALEKGDDKTVDFVK